MTKLMNTTDSPNPMTKLLLHSIPLTLLFSYLLACLLS